MAASGRAVVAARGRPRHRCRARPAGLGRRRQGVRGQDAALSRSALHAERRRSDPEPRHQPEDGERDRRLRERAPGGGTGERPAARAAARQDRDASDHVAGAGGTCALAARRDHRGCGQRPEGGARVRVTLGRSAARGVDLRAAEDRFAAAADPGRQGPARDGQRAHRGGAEAAGGDLRRGVVARGAHPRAGEREHDAAVLRGQDDEPPRRSRGGRATPLPGATGGEQRASSTSRPRWR